MEKERRKLDRQLDLAQEKTKKANLGQEVLEAKIKVCSNTFYPFIKSWTTKDIIRIIKCNLVSIGLTACLNF